MEATTLTSLYSSRAQHSVNRDVLALEEVTSLCDAPDLSCMAA